MVADAGGSSAIGRDHPGPEVAGHVAREAHGRQYQRQLNRVRARDAARFISLTILNGQETASGSPQMRFTEAECRKIPWRMAAGSFAS